MAITPDEGQRNHEATPRAASVETAQTVFDGTTVAPSRDGVARAISPATLEDVEFDRRALIDRLDGPDLDEAPEMAEAVAHYFKLVGHIDPTASAENLSSAFRDAQFAGEPTWGFDPKTFNVTEKVDAFTDPEKRKISAAVSAVSVGGTHWRVVNSRDVSLARPVSIDEAISHPYQEKGNATKEFETAFDLFDYLVPEEAREMIRQAYLAAQKEKRPFSLSLTLPFPVDFDMVASHLSGKWRCEKLAPFHANEARKDEQRPVPEIFAEYLQDRLGIEIDPSLLAISLNDTEADINSEAPDLAKLLAENPDAVIASFIIGTGSNIGLLLKLPDGKYQYINMEAGHNLRIRPSLLDQKVCDDRKNPADFEILVATKYMAEIFQLALHQMVGDHPVANQLDDIDPKEIVKMMFYLAYEDGWQGVNDMAGSPGRAYAEMANCTHEALSVAEPDGGDKFRLTRHLSSLRAKADAPAFLKSRTLNEMHLLRETARPFIERAAKYAAMMIQAIQQVTEKEAIVFGDGSSLTRNPKHVEAINAMVMGNAYRRGEGPLRVSNLKSRYNNNTGHAVDMDPATMGTLYNGLQRVLTMEA